MSKRTFDPIVDVIDQTRNIEFHPLSLPATKKQTVTPTPSLTMTGQPMGLSTVPQSSNHASVTALIYQTSNNR
jgi:hypothetical protein